MSHTKNQIIQTESVDIGKIVEVRDQEIQICVEDPNMQEKLDFLNELMDHKNKLLQAKMSKGLFDFYPRISSSNS